ncbi:MAG: hypothetical protein KJ900_13605 [Proteobacteria bacterium]|jgi:hypothetical protein|nr:hypothetical protein [Pseudomonadota bacterium]MCG2744503.1 hypothetical protein [Desulfobacteraceae bacterium]MBU3982099.1 hypothetical protein [Pseudomonadota bacterium]MBU4029184.1 hypothetical protein [Pseudomonadota bacterium]MBU4043913.1 hypothetical protein [Pseudomonadota bacterium]
MNFQKNKIPTEEKSMTEEKTKAPGEEKKPKTTPGYMEIIVITTLIVCSAIWGYDQFFAQKVFTFDLKGYLREQTALIKAGEMTEEQFKSNLDRTEAILNAEAEKSNHVILLKDVIVRNGNEISPK